MSSIINGGDQITIGAKATLGFSAVFSGGWPGIMVIQPQPISFTSRFVEIFTLNYEENAVFFNDTNGNYGFNYSITNNSSNPALFNIQYSTI